MLRLFQEQKATVVSLMVLALIALSSLVVIPETEQGVILRLGEPARVINRYQPHADFGQTGAGLTWRLPFFETLTRIDKRMLTVSMDRQQVLSTDQQPLEVDAYARFRIIDPVRMVKSAGTTEKVIAQLLPILSSQLRQELGKRSFQSLLT
ncbi:MAG: SPFH domain-containing protein, partial [Novosphingobium sp.]